MYCRFWLIPKILVLATKITEQAPWTRGIFFDLKYLETQIWNGVDFSGAKVPAVALEAQG
jgi:hypothetical protein